MLPKNFPGFKMAFRKMTFSPVLFGQIARIIVKTCRPESVYIGRTTFVMDLVILSTRDDKVIKTLSYGKRQKYCDVASPTTLF